MATSTIHRFLPVPSVQELAQEALDEVPSRYIWEDVHDPASNPSNPSLQVPVIDMAQMLDPDSQEKELLKLANICRDWGVFQLVNHGVKDELVQSMKKKCQGFFNLPLQERKQYKQYAQKEGSMEGYGQAFVTSEGQRLEWSDMLFINAFPVKDRNYSFWPQEPQGFRSFLQIRKGGYWVPVNVVSRALLVFVGNIAEMMSNGIYKSPEHRVVVNSLKERQTIVTFCYPNERAIIRPSPNLVMPENPALYKTLSHADYFNRFFSQKTYYDNFIDTLKIDALP